MLKFRSIELSDAPQVQKQLNDLESQTFVGGCLKPKSIDYIEKWIQQKQESENIFYAITVNSEYSGYIQLTSLDLINGTAVLGINIMDGFKGKGVGRQSLSLIQDLAKNHYFLRKIFLYVRGDNHSAIKLYNSLGYNNVGCLVNHIRAKEGFVDLILMEKFL